ncbi:helix-turn-helix domain-containing protein [Nocardioides sp. CN2-186]|uniref:TetR/AcrR family transcriptional regulator n=1 Tax=Nocardioides tweenelious TaxID=3156607 RepID=UPI0032B5D767
MPQRPRDRKQRILVAAADLFAAEGFDQVPVSRIAAAVEITPGALYRHYAGKEDLLAAVLLDHGDRMLAAAEGDLPLDELLERQAAEAARLPALGVLWARELRHLGPEARGPIVERTRVANQRYATALRTARPDLSGTDAELVAWALESVLVSTSDRVRGLREAELAETLAAVCGAVARVDLPSAVASYDAPPSPLRPVSKRENLLVEAGRLFGERGYQATSLADVGKAVGLTGPGVYSHFASKEELVAAALERAYHAAWLDLHAALGASATPGEALGLLVASYVGFAHRQPFLVTSLVSDPSGPTGDWVRRQREYVAEWDALLAAHRPELDAGRVHVLVRAAMTTVGNLARMRAQATRPTFRAEAIAIATAVLTSPVHHPAS